MSEYGDESLELLESELRKLRPHKVSEQLHNNIKQALANEQNVKPASTSPWRYIAASIFIAACLITGVSIFLISIAPPGKPIETVVVDISQVSNPMEHTQPTLWNYSIAFAKSQETFDQLLEEHGKVVANGVEQELDIEELLNL